MQVMLYASKLANVASSLIKLFALWLLGMIPGMHSCTKQVKQQLHNEKYTTNWRLPDSLLTYDFQPYKLTLSFSKRYTFAFIKKEIKWN